MIHPTLLTGNWRALTVRPPWSWALLHAGKTVENRSWEMTYRGPLWLHAGARSRWDPAGARNEVLARAWDRHVRTRPSWPGLPMSDVELGRRTTLMPFGAITALIEVTGCHHAAECSRWDHKISRVVRCTPWAAGDQFHIERTIRHILPEPVPCHGRLGLWPLPGEVEAAASAQLLAAQTVREAASA